MKYVLGTGAILVAIGAAAYFYIKHLDEDAEPTKSAGEETFDSTPGTNI